MNMEAGIGGQVDRLDDDQRARRRRLILIGALVLIVLGIAAVLIARRGGKPVAAADPAPSVTVIVPGRHAVASSLTATGNIGARRDMPVGIAGEGGIVRQVLVEAGDWVRGGQVLAVIDRSVQTQQANALAGTIVQARADAALAKANLDRAGRLVGNGFISKADLDTRKATVASADARVAVAQAQLAQQRALISRLDIRAPAGGLVLTRAVEAGQIVGAQSGGLFRVAMDGAMEVQTRLAEGDLARLRIGSPAWVTPVGTTLRIAGRVWQISPVIDPNTRQGMVRVALPFDKALRPGGFATVEIGGSATDVPLLPESAVLSDSKGNFVYVVGTDDRVQRRDVKVGDVNDRGVSVVAGLTGQEHVVASAGAFLNGGDKVTPTITR